MIFMKFELNVPVVGGVRIVIVITIVIVIMIVKLSLLLIVFFVLITNDNCFLYFCTKRKSSVPVLNFL